MPAFAMELNLGTLLATVIGGMFGSLGTAIFMISKFDRRIGIVETHTNSIPGLVTSLHELREEFAFLKGQAAAE